MSSFIFSIRSQAVWSTSDIVVYSDTLGRQSNSDLRIDGLYMPLSWLGWFALLISLVRLPLRHWGASYARVRSAIILSDSMSVLQAISNTGNKLGQQTFYTILQAAKNTKRHGILIWLQWTPAHCSMPGNDTADLLPKQAPIPGKTLYFLFSLKLDGTPQARSLRLMGEGMERVEDWRSSASDR